MKLIPLKEIFNLKLMIEYFHEPGVLLEKLILFTSNGASVLDLAYVCSVLGQFGSWPKLLSKTLMYMYMYTL